MSVWHGVHVIYQTTWNGELLYFSFNTLFFQERWWILINEKLNSSVQIINYFLNIYKFTYADSKPTKTDKLLILKIRICKMPY